MLRCGLCRCWPSAPPLTGWPSPETSSRTEVATSLRSSRKTRARAPCSGTYSGNTSNPRSSMRSGGWGWSVDTFTGLLEFWPVCFNLPSPPAAGEAAERADGVQQSGGRGLGTGTAQLQRDGLHPRPALTRASSRQGHLTRFLSFGLGLSVTAIEADRALVAMAARFDAQLVCTLEKDKRNRVGFMCFSDRPQRQTLNRVRLSPEFLLAGVTAASTPRGGLDQPQSLVGGLSAAAERRRRASASSNRAQSEETAQSGHVGQGVSWTTLPTQPAGLDLDRPPRLR